MGKRLFYRPISDDLKSSRTDVDSNAPMIDLGDSVVVDAVALGNFLIAICANGDNRILLWDGISRYEEVKMGYQPIEATYQNPSNDDGADNFNGFVAVGADKRIITSNDGISWRSYD